MRVIDYGRLTRRAVGVDARRLEFAVVDLETTGLDPAAGDRVCEVAVVRMRGDGTVLAEHSSLIHPGPALNSHELGGTEFHAIRGADLTAAPAFADVAPGLLRLLSGAVVVGHKLAFEDTFLGAEFARLGRRARLPGLCTLTAIRSQLDLERYGLSAATQAITGHSPTAQHTALGDARACALLLASLLAAAPAPLHYTGPPPPPADDLPAGLGNTLPREPPPARAGGAIADRVPAASAAPMPLRWHRHELNPERCLGRYGAEERAAAVAAARWAHRLRFLGRAAFALTPALLAAALR